MEEKIFKISESQLKIYGQELLMWGQEKRLEPYELSLVLSMTSDFIKTEVGMEIKETCKIKD